LKLSAKEPLYRLIPSVNAQAQLRVLPDPLPTERATDETVTVNLTWAIFDQGARYADRKTRLAQAESQQLDAKLLRRSVATDVELAVIALRTAREAYRIAGDAVAAATRLTEETEVLYKQGLARAIELTTANSQRFDAEVSRASAKLSMEQAYLELRFALGLGPIDEELPK
jgi:outer membrane protein TolC